MKRNNCIYFLFLCFFICTIVKGQIADRLLQTNANFFSITNRMDIYFDSLRLVVGDSILNDEGGEYAIYNRWKLFWRDRITSNGDFTAYDNSIKTFYDQLYADYIAQSSALTPWENIGPKDFPQITPTGGSNARGVGPVEFISFCPTNPQKMLTANVQGGLFLSTDGGDTWAQAGTDVQWPRSGCSWAVFSPADENTIFAINPSVPFNNESGWLGSTGGIYRTTNAGATWQVIGNNSCFNGFYNRLFKILVSDANPNVGYVSALNGIYFSNDINSTTSNCVWSLLTHPLVTSRVVWDLEFMPGTNNQTLLATTADVTIVNGNYTYTNWSVVQSNDGGVTWFVIANIPASINNAKHVAIEVSAATPNKFYCLVDCCGGFNDQLYVYDNGTWMMTNSSIDATFGRCHSFGVSPLNFNYVGTSNGIDSHFSGNNGITFGPSVYAPHDDVEDVVYHPININEIWICTHGGPYKSVDGGLTFTPQCNGLNCAEADFVSTSASSPDYVIIGAYHCGSSLTFSPHQNNWNPVWKNVMGGDGLRPLIDPTNPNYQFASFQSNLWRRTENLWNNTSTIDNASVYFESEGVLNQIDPRIIYRVQNSGGKAEIRRSLGRGDNLFPSIPISNFQSLFSSYYLSQLYVSKFHKDVLLAFLVEIVGNQSITHLQLSTNPNAATPVFNDLILPHNTFSGISDVEVDKNNPNIFYILYNNGTNTNSLFAQNKIYKADYTNINAPVFTDLTYDLPNVASGKKCLEIEQGSDGGIYVGTDVGVFYINNKLITNGQYWTLLGTALPHVSITGLEINYKINRLRVALSGKGVWEHDLYCPSDYDLTINGNLNTNIFYEAEHDIVSDATITGSATVYYRSGNEIKLLPGFISTATTNSDFKAFIHPCNSPGNSFYRENNSSSANENKTERNEPLKNTGIVVYPNPSTGIFKITKETDAVAQITVYNLLGNVILKSTISPSSSSGQEGGGATTIDLTCYAKGIYFVTVTECGKVYSQKVMVE